MVSVGVSSSWEWTHFCWRIFASMAMSTSGGDRTAAGATGLRIYAPRLHADSRSGGLQARVHPRHLLHGEHEHGVVVHIIHVVDEHVAVGPVVARDMRERRLAVVRR